MASQTESRFDTSDRGSFLEAFQTAILELVGEVPEAREAHDVHPARRSRYLASVAAGRAALLSGTLSIPVGPAGFLTILPDLLGVWRIQRQLVTDVAGAYGREAYLTREQMIYCLFRHAASQAVRDLAVRVGERVIIREASLHILQRVLRNIGLRVSERFAGRMVSRLLPVIGAVGVAGYSYYDTMRVGRTAARLFQAEEQTLLLPESTVSK